MSGDSTFFIGDVSLDDYYLADRWPDLAEKDFVTEAGSFVGGSIANAASVHAALGGKTEFVSLLNHSPISERLCAELQARGVSARHMLRQDGIAESRNLIFLSGGEHVVLTVDMSFQPMELPDTLMAELRQPGFVYTTLYRARRLRHGDLSGASLLADLNGHGRRAVFDLDVGGFAAADLPYLRGAKAVIMNQLGYSVAFGERPVSALADWMAEQGVSLVIRTRAAQGAEAFDGAHHYEVPGYRVPVVDVTGAGDTFGGSLIYAISQGANLREALDLAVAASARAVTVQGPAGGIVSPDELRAFRAEHYRRT